MSIDYCVSLPANVELSQRSTSETSFYGSSHWSPIAGHIDSARDSEVPPDSHFDSADHFDAVNSPDPYWKLGSNNYNNTLANVAGLPSDFSPLLLPFDEQSAYDSRPNLVSADSYVARSSLQLHKPFTVRSQSTTSQRKQSAGVSLESPAGSKALAWTQEEELQDGLSPFFSAPEDSLNLNDFSYL